MDSANVASAEEMLDQVLADIPMEQPKEAAPAEEAPAEVEAQADEDAPASGEPEEAAEGAEVEAKAEEPEEAELEAEAEKATEEALSPRANERFQKLANERNELRAQLEQHQAYMAQMQQQMHQQRLAQEQAARSRQEELAAQQLQILQAQQAEAQKRAEKERYESMSVADQWKHDTEQAALRKAEQAFSGKFKQLEQKFAQIEQEKQHALETARRQQTLTAFESRAANAAKPVADIFPEAERQGLVEDLKDAVLTYAAAYAIPPEEAGKKFQQVLDAYHNAKLKGTSRSKQSVTAAPKQAVSVPKTSVPVRGKAGSNSAPERPSWDKLKQHGYDDYLDWLEKGQPTLV
jgi:DNA repair exonuclease SbcCD ATPase subunit